MGPQMHTSSHPPTALLLFDTSYNAFLVLCPTLETHSSVHRCTTHTQAHTHIHRQTEAHNTGSTAKPVKLSKPQFRGNEDIPQSALPTRNDSISLLAECTYTFSSYFVKQAHSILHSNRGDGSLFFSVKSELYWNKGLTEKKRKGDEEKTKIRE